MKKRNTQIDILRAILILAIVFFHYTFRFSSIYKIPTIDFPTLAKWGTIGVIGFFIISGYFLRPKDSANFKISTFLKNKLTRLYPTYLLAIIVIFISTTLFGLPGRTVSFTDFLLNIPLLNGFIGIPYVDGAHWYITYLLIFTIIVAIISKLKIKPKYYLPAWLIIKDLVLFASTKFSILALPYKFIGGDYVEFIIIGLALAELLRFKEKDQKLKLFYIAIIIAALAQSFFLFSPVIALGTILVLIVFILTIKEKLSIFEKSRILTAIGKSSYCLYLFHQNIGYQIILALTALIGTATITPIIFITMLTMIIATAIIHYVFEKPIQERL